MNFLSIIMLIFAVIAGIDRIFGSRLKLGTEFEKGFYVLGDMGLSMVGMIVLAPYLAELLAPMFNWFYTALGIDPSIIPASLFANDMGGAPLAKEIAKNESVGMFNALVVSSMMGATVSFTIPYALSVVKKELHKEMFLGFLCGIATVFVGCFVVGLMLAIPVITLIINLLPLIVFSAIIVLGLLFIPNFTVKIFKGIGFVIKGIITIGLLIGMVEFLTGLKILPVSTDIKEGAVICFNAAIVLAGAFPFMKLISMIISKPLEKSGEKLKINSTASLGIVSSIVTNVTTFKMLNDMDKKGAVLNSAFAVSASFLIGGHLAFTTAFDSSYALYVVLAKLISGISGLVLAIFIYNRIYKNENI